MIKTIKSEYQFNQENILLKRRVIYSKLYFLTLLIFISKKILNNIGLK